VRWGDVLAPQSDAQTDGPRVQRASGVATSLQGGELPDTAKEAVNFHSLVMSGSLTADTTIGPADLPRQERTVIAAIVQEEGEHIREPPSRQDTTAKLPVARLKRTRDLPACPAGPPARRTEGTVTPDPGDAGKPRTDETLQSDSRRKNPPRPGRYEPPPRPPKQAPKKAAKTTKGTSGWRSREIADDMVEDVAEVMGEEGRWNPDKEVFEHRLLIRWAGGSLPRAHVALAIQRGYQPTPGYPQPDPEDPDNVLVEWEPTWELRNVLQNIDDDTGKRFWQPIVLEFWAGRGRQPPDPESDDVEPGMRDVERIGARKWREPSRPDAGRTTISTKEVNPDSDIHPGPHHRLLVRVPVVGPKTVMCYSPAGKLVGQVSDDRLADLWRRWRGDKAEGDSPLEQAGFARDVAALLARYNKDLTNHWALPADIYSTLKYALGIDTERFASPLNVSPSTEVYYSFYKEDEVFGATHDAYSTPFLTPSGVNPEYTPSELAKALKWAVQSTYLEDHPQVHILIYPVWEGEPYKKWLLHPRVHKLCRVPQGKFNFRHYDSWTGKAPTAGRNSTKWDVDLLLVANPAGMHAHYDHTTVSRSLQQVLLWHTDRRLEVHEPPRHMWSAAQDRPRGMARVVRCFDAGDLLDVPPQPPPARTPQSTQPVELPAWLPTLGPEHMAHKAYEWVYTDGSSLQTKAPDGTAYTSTGAAVYDAVEDTIQLVNPMTTGGRNHTVNRAELAAIYAALDKLRDREHLKILTDSQASIHAILNEIHQPMRTSDHLHRELLTAIATLAMDRDRAGKRTTILKVRAHAGVVGNEVADSAAKYQAHGHDMGQLSDADKWPLQNLGYITLDDDRMAQIGIGVAIPSSTPLTLQVPVSMLPGGTEGDDSRELRPDDPRVDALLASKYATFGSNTDAAHHRMLQQQNDPALGRHHKISTRYMRSGQFTHKDRLLIHKLRHGVFQTQKRDHMMRPKVFPDPNCVLCRDGRGHATPKALDGDNAGRDGCGHVMGGCMHPQLRSCYIKRHNEAVARIARALAAGDLGRWLLVADLNKEDREGLAGEVHREVHSRIPEGLLPGVEQHLREKLRPDILFAVGMCHEREALLTHPGVMLCDVGSVSVKNKLELWRLQWW